LQRYFFHQVYEEMQVADLDGDFFPSIELAQIEAVVSARHMMGDALRRGALPKFGKIQICDSLGTILKEVSFREALGL
jgi:hypothetical protein